MLAQHLLNTLGNLPPAINMQGESSLLGCLSGHKVPHLVSWVSGFPAITCDLAGEWRVCCSKSDICRCDGVNFVSHAVSPWDAAAVAKQDFTV